MGLLRDIHPRASPENPSTNLGNPATWLTSWMGGEESEAGARVNEETALGITAVWACVRVISETIGSLPLFVYEDETGGRRKATKHPLYLTLHEQPNTQMTSMVCRETLMGHVLLWGNAYAELVRGGRLEIKPLPPNRVEPVLAGDRIVYIYDVDGDGKRLRRIQQEDMLHVPGLSFDGCQGYSPVRLGLQALGLTKAVDTFGARFFKNGSVMSGLLTHPGRVTPEGAKLIRESWAQIHSGAKNAHRVGVLEEGMTFTQLSIPPNDAQMLETRRFQTVEIARMFRVQLHMIQDLTHATFSNVEHQAIAHVRDTIRPWCVRLEQELNRKLFRAPFFCEHQLEGLMRGDMKSRFEAYAIGRTWSWLSPNDVRRLENQPDIPEGDKYHVPLNMVPTDEPRPEPAAPDDDPEPEDGPEDRSRPTETRALLVRRRQHAIYRELLADPARRFIGREIQQIDLQLRKLERGSQSRQGFLRWLDNFYRENHPPHVKRALKPVLVAYAKEIAALASEEIGAEQAGDTSAMARDYLDAFSARHNERQLRAMQKAIEETATDDAAAAAGRITLNLWQDGAADVVGRRESVKAGAFFAKMAWAAAGVTALRWSAFGDNCPACQSIDGRVVGISGDFVGKNEPVFAGDQTIVPTRSISHPPLHNGCDCMIRPE